MKSKPRKLFNGYSLMYILFGVGVEWNDLTREQQKHYSAVSRRIRYSQMTDEERKEHNRLHQRQWKENGGIDHYRAYQRKYRKKRRETDEEFKQRVDQHTRNYQNRKHKEDK